MIEFVKMNLCFDSKSFEIKSQNSSVFHEIMDVSKHKQNHIELAWVIQKLLQK